MLGVSGVTGDRNQAKITFLGVPDRPGIASRIFGPIGSANILVDMIIQNVGQGDLTDLSFTIPRGDLQGAVILCGNPDGMLRGTRGNGSGVDLNRNFPFHWRPAGRPWDALFGAAVLTLTPGRSLERRLLHPDRGPARLHRVRARAR